MYTYINCTLPEVPQNNNHFSQQGNGDLFIVSLYINSCKPHVMINFLGVVRWDLFRSLLVTWDKLKTRLHRNKGITTPDFSQGILNIHDFRLRLEWYKISISMKSREHCQTRLLTTWMLLQMELHISCCYSIYWCVKLILQYITHSGNSHSNWSNVPSSNWISRIKWNY